MTTAQMLKDIKALFPRFDVEKRIKTLRTALGPSSTSIPPGLSTDRSTGIIEMFPVVGHEGKRRLRECTTDDTIPPGLQAIRTADRRPMTILVGDEHALRRHLVNEAHPGILSRLPPIHSPGSAECPEQHVATEYDIISDLFLSRVGGVLPPTSSRKRRRVRATSDQRSRT